MTSHFSRVPGLLSKLSLSVFTISLPLSCHYLVQLETLEAKLLSRSLAVHSCLFPFLVRHVGTRDDFSISCCSYTSLSLGSPAFSSKPPFPQLLSWDRHWPRQSPSLHRNPEPQSGCRDHCCDEKSLGGGGGLFPLVSCVN